MSNRALLPVVVLAAGATLLHGQAIIEYGASAGRSAASAGAAGAGRSAATIFDKVGKSLAGSAKTDDAAKGAPVLAVSPVVTVANGAAPTPPAPPAVPADFSALVTGMDRADLMSKVGKPSMSMTSTESSKVVETCWYRNGTGNVTVILRDGNVAEISGLEKAPAKDTTAKEIAAH